MIEEVQCISARCGDEYKILLIRVSNMRPIAGLRLQTELWESDNMAIDIIKDECKECGIYDYHVEFYDRKARIPIPYRGESMSRKQKNILKPLCPPIQICGGWMRQN